MIKTIISWGGAIVLSVIMIGYIIHQGRLDIFIPTQKDHIDTCGDHICQEKCYICPQDCGPCYQERTPPPTIKYGKSCTLPRGSTIKDGYGVYAFANRTDSPSICNIQLRMCNDGKLSGQYTQPYCLPKKERFYDTTPPPSNNATIPDTFVQPGPPPIVGPFDEKGQIIDPDKYKPIIIPNIPYQRPSIATNIENTKGHCITPWGEIVPHGQFIKAYKFPEGFNDQPCEVQLRTCSDGILLGNYMYQDCNPIDRFAEAKARTEQVFFDPLPPGTRGIIDNLHHQKNKTN